MDEDAVDGTDTADETMQWRRDASTSHTVRLLWAFGVGTFFAAIGTVVCWRLYRLGSEAAGGPGGTVVLAFIAAFAATVLALAASSHTEAHLTRIAEGLPIDAPTGTSLNRAIDAAVGTVVMGAVIGALMGIGWYVSQNELLAAGAGPFTGLAALLIPGALSHSSSPRSCSRSGRSTVRRGRSTSTNPNSESISRWSTPYPAGGLAIRPSSPSSTNSPTASTLRDRVGSPCHPRSPTKFERSSRRVASGSPSESGSGYGALGVESGSGYGALDVDFGVSSGGELSALRLHDAGTAIPVRSAAVSRREAALVSYSSGLSVTSPASGSASIDSSSSVSVASASSFVSRAIMIRVFSTSSTVMRTPS